MAGVGIALSSKARVIAAKMAGRVMGERRIARDANPKAAIALLAVIVYSPPVTDAEVTDA